MICHGCDDVHITSLNLYTAFLIACRFTDADNTTSEGEGGGASVICHGCDDVRITSLNLCTAFLIACRFTDAENTTSAGEEEERGHQ